MISTMLEIGCGLGSYVPFFLRNGWNYEAVESSKFAAYWTRNTFDVDVHEKTFEKFHEEPFVPFYHLIFAAHVLEHMESAPLALVWINELLKPDGQLMLIVPDDSDPTNPGHQWFFTEPTLRALLEQKGFKNIRTAIRKRVERENFIYCVAEK
jgi:SAM-dependent methyltransferase